MPLKIYTKFDTNIVIDSEIIPLRIKRLGPDEAIDFNRTFQRNARWANTVAPKEETDEQKAKREAHDEEMDKESRLFIVRSITNYVETLPGHLFLDDEEVTKGADVVRMFGAREDVLSELLSLIFLENRLDAQDKSDWKVKLAPFVPTPARVADRMMEMAEVTDKDTLYDLGCGSGRLCIAAAKRGAKTYGWDINPERVAEARKAAEEAGVSALCVFDVGDVMKVDTSPATVVSLYLLAGANIKLRSKLLKELAPGARIVSHTFKMGPDWPAEKSEMVPTIEGEEEPVHSGQRTVHVYHVDRIRPVAVPALHLVATT